MNEVRKIKIETPIGSVESDSGNHLVDIASVIVVIVVFFVIRRLMGKWTP